MTLPMFMAYYRPLVKDTPITTFDAVCRLLRRFTANSLLLGFNERAWRAYTSDLLSDADSAALALCPQLAIVSVAVADGAAQATVVDIEELLLQWIAIKGVVPELMQTQAMELARIVSAHNLASAVPDLKKSYQVMKSALLGRFYRNQLLTRQNELEDLTRLGSVPIIRRAIFSRPRVRQRKDNCVQFFRTA